MNLNHSDLPMEEASVPKTEAVPELEDMISNPNQATALDPVQTDSESVAITDPGARIRLSRSCFSSFP